MSRLPLKMCTRCGTILSRVQPTCWGCYLRDTATYQTHRPAVARGQRTEFPISEQRRMKPLGGE